MDAAQKRTLIILSFTKNTIRLNNPYFALMSLYMRCVQFYCNDLLKIAYSNLIMFVNQQTNLFFEYSHVLIFVCVVNVWSSGLLLKYLRINHE